MSRRRRAPQQRQQVINPISPPTALATIPSLDFSCLQTNQTYCSSPPRLKRGGDGSGADRNGSNRHESLVQRRERLEPDNKSDTGSRRILDVANVEQAQNLKLSMRRKIPRELKPLGGLNIEREREMEQIRRDMPYGLGREPRQTHKLPSLSRSDGGLLEEKYTAINSTSQHMNQSLVPRKGPRLQPIQNLQRRQPTGRTVSTRPW